MTKCKVCSAEFQPFQPLQQVCGIACARRVPIIARNTLKAQAKAERIRHKARQDDAKPRRDWMKLAKTEMQRYRRLEELSLGRTCISCKRSREEITGTEGWKPGGCWDGGHFISKGAAPELSLEPKNIWLQCKSCNAGSGKYARKGMTVNKEFRANLVAQGGQELIDWLEGPHEAKKYTIEELKSIIAQCRLKVKKLNATSDM